MQLWSPKVGLVSEFLLVIASQEGISQVLAFSSNFTRVLFPIQIGQYIQQFHRILQYTDALLDPRTPT